jgi:hypothetical protein
MRLTNVTGVSLPIAVWLAADGYDFTPMGRSISATAILKPVRQILLRERLKEVVQETPDVTDYIASRLGHTIHDGIEQAWKKDYKSSMLKLGYPQKIIDKIEINPEKPNPDNIQVWLEQRSSREINGYTISGKFDMVLEGVLQDFKSTSAYTAVYGSNDENYRLQGSIYKWLNPTKIFADHMNIQFIFTDWSKAMAKQNSSYPQQRVKEHRVELMSIEETSAWIKGKLRVLEAHADLSEPALPFCTDEELWRGEHAYKYYSNPAKTDGRSTRNFSDLSDANAFQAQNGKGVVITVPGKVKACGYCPAFTICTQKDLYEHG